MSSSHTFCAGIPEIVPTSAESFDPACFSIRIFRRVTVCCNHKAGQWMCRTCPASRRDASPFAAVLSVRSSACILKPKSSIGAASPTILHAPRTTAHHSPSPNDREITTCVVVPAKIGCLPSFRSVHPQLFSVTVRAAQFASLSPTILDGTGCRG